MVFGVSKARVPVSRKLSEEEKKSKKCYKKQKSRRSKAVEMKKKKNAKVEGKNCCNTIPPPPFDTAIAVAALAFVTITVTSLAAAVKKKKVKNKGDKVTKFLSIFNYRPICLSLFALFSFFFYFPGLIYFFFSVIWLNFVTNHATKIGRKYFSFFFSFFDLLDLTKKKKKNLDFIFFNSFSNSALILPKVL